MHSRRLFLKGSALAMFGVGSLPAWLSRSLYAADSTGNRKKILVAIFQRGAVDGLNMVVPFGEPRYYQLRPSIAIPKPDGTATSAVDLDGFFGLHPSLSSLKPLYAAQHLAIVDAVGSPDPTRSHFDAQDYMESGTPGRKATDSGWMNRALPKIEGKESPVRAVALGAQLPRAMRGREPALALQSIGGFQVRDEAAAMQFEQMYKASKDPVLQAAGRETFEAMAMLQSIQKQPYVPAGGADYRGPFGNSLKQIAQLIKSDVGVEMAFADIGNWDHHVNEVAQRSTEGQLANRLQ